MEEIEPRAAMGADAGRYRSYLLRFWREASDGPWRSQVHCVGTGQERRFADLAGLFGFLESEFQLARGRPVDPPPGAQDLVTPRE